MLSSEKLIRQIPRSFKVNCFVNDICIKCSRTCRVQTSATIGKKGLKSGISTLTFKNAPEIINNQAKIQSSIEFDNIEFIYDIIEGKYRPQQLKIQIKFIHQGIIINLGQVSINLAELLNSKDYKFSGIFPIDKCYDNTASLRLQLDLQVFDQEYQKTRIQIQRVIDEALNLETSGLKQNQGKRHTFKQVSEQSKTINKQVLKNQVPVSSKLNKQQTSKNVFSSSSLKESSVIKSQKINSIMKQSIQIAKDLSPDDAVAIQNQIKEQIDSVKDSYKMSQLERKDKYIHLLTEKLLEARKANIYLKIANHRILQFQEKVEMQKNHYAMEVQNSNQEIHRLLKQMGRFKGFDTKGVNTMKETEVCKTECGVNATVQDLIKQTQQQSVSLKQSLLLIEQLKSQIEQNLIEKQAVIGQAQVKDLDNIRLKQEISILKKKLELNMKSDKQIESKSIQVIQKLKNRAISLQKTYQDKIEQIELQKQALVQSINQLKLENTKCRSQSFQIKLIFQSKKKQFQLVKKKFEEYKGKQQAQKKKMQGNQIDLKKKDRMIQNLKHENMNLNIELEQLRTELRFANQSNKQMHRQISQFHQRLHFNNQREHITVKQHQQQLELKNIKIDWLTQKNKNFHSEIERSKIRIKNSEQKIAQLSSRLKEKEDQVEQLKKEVQTAKQQNQRQIGQITLLEQQNAQLLSRMNNPYITVSRKVGQQKDASIDAEVTISFNDNMHSKSDRKTQKKIAIQDNKLNINKDKDRIQRNLLQNITDKRVVPQKQSNQYQLNSANFKTTIISPRQYELISSRSQKSFKKERSASAISKRQANSPANKGFNRINSPSEYY